jgi:hypothetical protein
MSISLDHWQFIAAGVCMGGAVLAAAAPQIARAAVKGGRFVASRGNDAAVVLVMIGIGFIVWASWPENPPDGPHKPSDAVSAAFDTYEVLWRKLAADAADRLDAGELSAEQAAWDFIASGNQEARKAAFADIAAAEAAILNEQWTPEKHAEILRGYK